MSRRHEEFCQKKVIFPALLVFMKLFGCILAESVNIYLIIRNDTVSGCLFAYFALCIVAKTDTLMAMTLPNTNMEEPLKYRKNLLVYAIHG
jgi:hypothetical protein